MSDDNEYEHISDISKLSENRRLNGISVATGIPVEMLRDNPGIPVETLINNMKLAEKEQLEHSEPIPATSETADLIPRQPVTKCMPIPNQHDGFEINYPQYNPTSYHRRDWQRQQLPSDSSQPAREAKFERTYELICQLYTLILNETNSLLIADNSTGKALPATFNAIEEPVTTQYRCRHSSSIPKSIIKDAFAQFKITEIPTSMPVFFGRAGYNPFTKMRYINTGSNFLQFGKWDSAYQIIPIPGMSYIAPTYSTAMRFRHNIGNVTQKSIEMLFQDTALSKDTDLLVIAWMILCWMPDRSQVMLELLGSPSSSMQLTQSALKNIIDPATTPLINELPQNKAQLDTMAHQQYLLSFNQIEALPESMQEHFFNLMQGKIVPWQWRNKKVEAEIRIQCPILLSGLESIASTNKLKAATLSVEINESIDTVGQSMDCLPLESLVSSLLSIYSHVNMRWSSVEHIRSFDHYSGLADLCRIGVLVAQFLNRDTCEFWQQLKVNERVQREYELEETPVAIALQSFIESLDKPSIDMSVKDWLTHLEVHRPKRCSDHDWPVSSRKLAAEFKNIQGLMRDHGVELKSTGQKGPLRHWQATLCQTDTDAPTPTPYELPPQSNFSL